MGHFEALTPYLLTIIPHSIAWVIAITLAFTMSERIGSPADPHGTDSTSRPNSAVGNFPGRGETKETKGSWLLESKSRCKVAFAHEGIEKIREFELSSDDIFPIRESIKEAIESGDQSCNL